MRQNSLNQQKHLLRKDKETCTDCKKTVFVINRAEGTLVCAGCGLVGQSKLIDETSEWRNFSNENGAAGENTRDRVGGKLNPYLSDFGLSTMVSGGGNLGKDFQMWN